ncbi:MAG: DUF2924 domain-containing protein [Luteimonas sp.]
MPKPARPDLPHWDTLAALDRQALAHVWQQAFGRPLPVKLYKAMVVRLLANRLQELALGGLSPRAHQYLKTFLPRPTDGKTRRGPARRLKLGTRLLREWQGRTHLVTVVADGFEYAGQPYRSLSVIARTITGTPWSGPAFFGLHPSVGKAAA